MLKRAQRRCKICRAKFTPAFENHRWCCPEHGAEFAMQELEKKREKQAQAKEKKERAAWRKRKAAVKPLRHWEDMTQRVVNDYIRERDHDLPCISCGTFETVQWKQAITAPAVKHLTFATTRTTFTSSAITATCRCQGTSSSTASPGRENRR